MTQLITVKDYICECLSACGVTHVFGYPGAAIIPLIDAVSAHPKLEWILTRHECSAAYCASATAKQSGKLSVCMATTGPGASNLITGLLDAQLDHAPVLAITGLLPTWKSDLPYFQNINQTSLLERVCGLSLECKHPAQIPSLMKTVIGYTQKMRGVAHLAIPHDIQEKKIPLVSSDFNSLPSNRPVNLMPPPKEAFTIIAETLQATDEIIIIVGSRGYHAGAAITELSQKINAPIITTFSAKGSIDETFENYMGVFGLYGSPSNPKAYIALEHAKVVIIFGVDDLLPFIASQDGRQHRTLIQCEPDVTAIDYRFIQHRTLLGPLEAIAKQLTNACQQKKASPFLKKILETSDQLKDQNILPIKPQYGVHHVTLLNCLNRYIDKDNVTVAFDIGDASVWASQYLQLNKQQKVILSHLLGTMGFCLPALIAAKLEKPEHTVIGITGDGGFQMSLSEINTAVQQKLHIIIIVFNNGVLQRVIAQQQKAQGTVIYSPNFADIANACGAKGLHIATPDDINSVLDEAFATSSTPVVIDVACDPHLFAPMSQWKDTFNPRY